MREPVELAGDRITLTHDGDHDTIHFSDKGTGRVCGDCQLCCKLLPVPGAPLHKPANTRCQHQRTGKGCGIYATRPTACRVFACRWLADAECAGMKRPDRSHYVVDINPDYVEAVDNATGQRTKIGVIQVWVDPHYRDAYRAPELRRYMLHIAERYRMATIVRYSSTEAFTVFPPPLASDGQWHEEGGTVLARTPDEREILARYKVGLAEERP
jgi:hypothetical protein